MGVSTGHPFSMRPLLHCRRAHLCCSQVFFTELFAQVLKKILPAIVYAHEYFDRFAFFRRHVGIMIRNNTDAWFSGQRPPLQAGTTTLLRSHGQKQWRLPRTNQQYCSILLAALTMLYRTYDALACAIASHLPCGPPLQLCDGLSRNYTSGLSRNRALPPSLPPPQMSQGTRAPCQPCSCVSSKRPSLPAHHTGRKLDTLVQSVATFRFGST